MTGAASINVPDTIAVRAKTPRKQGSDVLPRTVGSTHGGRRARRGTGRWHLHRRRRLGLVLFFHTRLEGLDAFGEIAHHPGQLPGAEEDQDNGQDHDPMHQAERTHNRDPGRLTDAYSSRSFRHLHRLVTRLSNKPEDSSPAAVRYDL